LDAVHKYGGVLEHPAGSHAWSAHGLTASTATGWQRGISREWVCEVWQSAYGSRTRKRTWLLYVGDTAPDRANASHRKGTHQIGKFDRIKPTLYGRAASETPLAFAEWLLSLAATARGPTR